MLPPQPPPYRIPMTDGLLYKNSGYLQIGDVHRFIITYTPSDINKEIGSNIYIKVKNVENVLMNSVLLTGPYLIYCDIRSSDYDHNKPCFITDDQPVFDPNILPGSSLIHKLTLNKLQDRYVWVVDIISQILFSTTAKTNFEILISKTDLNLNKYSYTTLKNSNYSPENLNIQHLTTLDIWNKPPKSLSDPIHLVILVHGLHSNSTADMFYILDNIEKMSQKTGENIVIRAYSGNVCKTERGIKYLGRRLAEYIVKDSMDGLNQDQVEKISFIGHSLGGPVQTFAISYINFNYPNFFDKIKPENFITMASPLLGISNENPTYVKVFLKFGIVGKTGQDLNLDGSHPLLLLLPSEPTRKILKKFKRRTVYANVLNDGIVPLRTSALLYLDWKGLSKVYQTIHNNGPPPLTTTTDTMDVPYISADNDQTSEIPVNIINNEVPPAIRINQVVESDSNFVGSFKNMIQSTVGYCLPGIQQPQKTTHKYNYFQTTESDDISTPSEQIDKSDTDNGNTSEIVKETFAAIPKSSALSSIKKVLLPPTPSKKYINDPKTRYNVILHDKIYTPDMIPKKHTKLSTNVIISQLEQKKRHRYFEEKIARRWHQGMSWRKVLVYLQPDAHNNMVVRRRFMNAYGWQVVDHLIDEHFSEKCFNGEDVSLWSLKKPENEFIDLDDEEYNDLNVKLGKVMNKEYKKESLRQHIKIPDKAKLKDYGHQTGIADIIDPPVPLNENNIITNSVGNSDTAELEKSFEESKAEAEATESQKDEDLESVNSADNGEWLNEASSGYYDGPTGLINSVTEGAAAWRESVTRAAGISTGFEDPNEEMKEINEVGELNAYI